ncbi:WG repeat-containing protein [uncultured Microscilla sp.]|uniref:WG repeat-containing protein n=1 Tax=uncultured Microscilla sp. TaxID=432653 RepID=UPI0026027902|nr:WG repeat-containing protein [uncultured Microscilla sp.]
MLLYLAFIGTCAACAIRPAAPAPPSCYAIATFYGKEGLINRQGEWVIEPKYKSLYFFNDRLLKVYAKTGDQEEAYLIDFEGKVVYAIPDSIKVWNEVFPGLFEAEIRIEKQPTKTGCINIKGKWVIAPQYDAMGDFSEGLVAVKRQGLWGFINDQGKEVIAPAHQQVEYFVNGLAMVKKAGLYGIINLQGGWEIPPVYQHIGRFVNGLAIAQKDSLYGLIDRQGKWAVPNRYPDISPQRVQGRLVVKDTTGKWGVMNEAGQWVLKPQYEYVQLLGANRAAVWQFTYPRRTALHFGRKRTLVALPSGKTIVFLNYDSFIYPFNQHGLAKILGDADLNWYKINDATQKSKPLPDRLTPRVHADDLEFGVYGLIDTMGNMVVATQYQFLSDFRGSVAIATPHAAYGWRYIRPDGSQIFAGHFAEARPFSQGWARVLAPADSLVFKRDKYGNRIPIPLPYYYGLQDREKMIDNRWGFINKKGEWMIKPRFDEVSDFYCIER